VFAALAQSEPIQEAPPRLASVVVQPYSPPIKPIESPGLRGSILSNANPTYSGGYGCVRYLRNKGIPVPQNPRILSKYLDVDSNELPPEGVPVIIVSDISPAGHVSWGVNDGGKLKNIYDSAGMAYVPISEYIGFIKV